MSYSLQTDWATLKNKGKLDYLYVLCDDQFEKFCALYFKGLTTEDFFPPANGSRGKSRMKKSSAMKKAVCLHGSFTTQNQKHINNYFGKLGNVVDAHLLDVKNLKKDYFSFDANLNVKNKMLSMKKAY